MGKEKECHSAEGRIVVGDETGLGRGWGLRNPVRSKKVEVIDHGRYSKALFCEAH